LVDIRRLEELIEENRRNPKFLKQTYRTVEYLFLKGRRELKPVLEKRRRYLSELGELEEEEFLSKIRQHQERALERFLGEDLFSKRVEKERPTSLVGKLVVEMDRITPIVQTLKDVIEYRLEKGIKIPVTVKFDLDEAISILERNLKILKDLRNKISA